MEAITITCKSGRKLYVALSEFDKDMLLAEAKSIGTNLSDYLRARIQDSRDLTTPEDLKKKFE